MSANSNEKPGRLDLGLSELMGQRCAALDSVREEGVERHAEVSDLHVDTSGQGDSILDDLASAQNWNKLIQAAEAALAGESPPSEAKVWWVRGHLGALSMPASFLAAPFEALCKQLNGATPAPSLQRALAATVPLLLKRLEEAGNADQIASLRSALSKITLSAPFIGLSSPASQGAENPQPSIAERPFTVAPSVSEAEILKIPDFRESTNGSGARGASRQMLMVVVLLVLLIVGARKAQDLLAGVAGFLGGATAVASEGFIVDGDSPEQKIPASDVRGSVGSLSALFYSIKGSEHESIVLPSSPPLPRDADRAQDLAVGGTGGRRLGREEEPVRNPTAPDASSSPPTAAPDKSKRVKVDTKGPREGVEFQQGVEHTLSSSASAPWDQEHHSPAASGRTQPHEALPRPQLPSVHDSPSMQRQRPMVEVSRMGRAERATSVYASASYGSEILGRLELGDRVMIEGNSGRWLRLRSRRGNGGYVRREDVSELEPHR